MQTRRGNKDKHPGYVDRGKTRQRGENGKTVKGMETERKVQKKKDEEDNIRRVFELEQAEATRHDTATHTTPAGPLRTKVSKVVKKQGRTVLSNVPDTTAGHSRRHLEGSDLNTRRKRKVRDAIEEVRRSTEMSNKNSTSKPSASRAVKRPHAYDFSVSF
jgi:hypothetical protein